MLKDALLQLKRGVFPPWQDPLSNKNLQKRTSNPRQTTRRGECLGRFKEYTQGDNPSPLVSMLSIVLVRAGNSENFNARAEILM